jgi:hypothetical protein
VTRIGRDKDYVQNFDQELSWKAEDMGEISSEDGRWMELA